VFIIADEFFGGGPLSPATITGAATAIGASRARARARKRARREPSEEEECFRWDRDAEDAATGDAAVRRYCAIGKIIPPLCSRVGLP